MIALALLLATTGFACLGYATDEHHHRLRGRRLGASGRRRWRVAGSGAIALAFPIAIAGRGWIVGPIAWTGMLMLAAGIVFLALNVARRAVKTQPVRIAEAGRRRRAGRKPGRPNVADR